MKTIVDMPEYLIKNIRELIKGGKYSDLSSFLTMSAENQLTMELSNEDEHNEYSKNTIDNTHNPEQKDGVDLSLLNKDISCISPPAKESLVVYNPNYAEEECMWGQINRILPIKFSIRLLSNLISEENNLLSYEDFIKEAQSQARKFGFILLISDKRFKRKRDEKFSVGFPIGKEEEKALFRFSEQFIGSSRKDGKLSGALPILRFANIISKNGSKYIGITKSGLEFSKLKNPCMDDLETNISLSDEEINFYCHHIKESVPGEYTLYKEILTIIHNGIDTRDSINDSLSRDINYLQNVEITTVNTQRAGTMSRMHELGLIEKIKNGIYVKYRITQKGKNFINI